MALKFQLIYSIETNVSKSLKDLKKRLNGRSATRVMSLKKNNKGIEIEIDSYLKEDDNKKYSMIIVRNHQILVDKEIKKLLKDFNDCFKCFPIKVKTLKKLMKKEYPSLHSKLPENYWEILLELEKHYKI